MRLWICLLAAVLFAPGCSPDAPPPTDSGSDPGELVGAYLGHGEHRGQRGSFALEIEQVDSGELVASVSLPDQGAWDMAKIPLTLDDGRLHLLSGSFEPTAKGGLSGVLPAELVPVHRVPIELRRVEALDKSELPAVSGPEARPLWTQELGSPVWGGLAVAGERLFVAADDGNLHALATSDGSSVWSFDAGGSLRGRPTLDDDSLLLLSDEGQVHALAVSTGQELWRARVAEPFDRQGEREQQRYNHYASGLARAGEFWVVGTAEGRVVALDAATGAERWSFQAGEAVSGTPVVAEGRVFVASFDHHAYSLDAATGEELWRVDTGAPIPGSPALFDDRVIFGSRSYDLLALDGATGEEAWGFYLWYSWIESTPTRRGANLYFGSSDAQLVTALVGETGELLWQTRVGGSAWARPAVSEDAVLIGALGVAGYSFDHRAAFFALDRHDGSILWRYPIEQPAEASRWGFVASPTIADDRVFAADLTGRVYAFAIDPAG